MSKKSIDDAKIMKKIRWWQGLERPHGLDINEYVLDPILELLGDEVDEILAYLDAMDIEDLDEISGLFCEIYGRWMTDEVWDAITKLENKIKAAHS